MSAQRPSSPPARSASPSGRAPSQASPRSTRQAIERVAVRAGFEVQWKDAHGRKQRVPHETLAALLAALGLPCSTDEEARESLAALDAEDGGHALPPLVTAECDQAIALPSSAIETGSRYRIELESGEAIEGLLGAPQGQLALLSPVAEPGYHWLLLGDRRIQLAVAPKHCYTVGDACRAAGVERMKDAQHGKSARGGKSPTGTRGVAAPAIWGIGTQLYGLRRVGDGGIGDYTALAAFAAESARRGAHVLAISPTHAMFSADAGKFSPYSPSSRLYLNVAHIDPAAVLGDEALREALNELGAIDAWAALEDEPLIDWPRAMKLRLAVLRVLFERFCTHDRTRGSQLAERFQSFCAHGGRALEDHARFEALDAWQRTSEGRMHWREWPAELAEPRSAKVEEYARDNRHEVEWHLFMQWLAAEGLANAQRSARDAGMAVGLVADLAVGCDGAGSHAWSYRHDMLQGVSVGAPPDLFNQAGQAWGLTTFSPRAMRNQGFSAFIDMLRASFAYAGGLRIDHVLGLQRLWLVPEGASPADGAYLAYPINDLLRLIALESWRHRAIVIGEDLGTVPAGFRDRLAEYGVLGMRVLWFERSEKEGRFRAPRQWSADALATTTTHDLPTVAGWWQGHDIDWRSHIGQTAPRRDGQDPVEAAKAERAADREALWRAFQQAGIAPDVPAPALDAPPVDEALAFVASTPAPLAIYPLEDLLGTDEQPNLPGSTDEHPNWRRRMLTPIDALFAQTAVADRVLAVSRIRASTRRSPESEPPRES